MKQNRYVYVVRTRFEGSSYPSWTAEAEISELQSSCFKTRSSASDFARTRLLDFLAYASFYGKVSVEVWRVSFATCKYERDRKYNLLEVWRNYPSEI